MTKKEAFRILRITHDIKYTYKNADGSVNFMTIVDIYKAQAEADMRAGTYGVTQAEIDELSSRGEIEWIDAKMLFMSIISLNVLPFIAFPIINLLMSGVGDKRDEFLNQRKEENVKTIMKRIQKI